MKRTLAFIVILISSFFIELNWMLEIPLLIFLALILFLNYLSSPNELKEEGANPPEVKVLKSKQQCFN